MIFLATIRTESPPRPLSLSAAASHPTGFVGAGREDAEDLFNEIITELRLTPTA
jgi:hypothetical protein